MTIRKCDVWSVYEGEFIRKVRAKKGITRRRNIQLYSGELK